MPNEPGFQPSVGKEFAEKLAAKKIFVVGAGGIGCELLKNLVLTGFTNIHVVGIFFLLFD